MDNPETGLALALTVVDVFNRIDAMAPVYPGHPIAKQLHVARQEVATLVHKIFDLIEERKNG